VAKRLRFQEVLALLEKAYGKPRTAEHPEAPLLDHLIIGVLTQWVDRERAVRAFRATSESFLDLNEARVSPIAELTNVLHPFLGSKAEEAAVGLRTALQDVYDGTHGLDLEPLRGRDPDDLRKFVKGFPHMQGGPAAAVFQLALGTEKLALMPSEQRVLDRLKVLPQTSTANRARVLLEKQVKPPERLAFAWAVGSHAGAVCHARDPLCESCFMLPHCPAGEAFVKQREIDRKKEEARRAADEKRRRLAAEKAAREVARKAAAEAKKHAIAAAKAAKIAAAKAAAEKVIADRKAKIEAERAEKKAKVLAERAAKKAKIDAERAERKAKLEAERKAKAEAAKKDRERAAKAKKAAAKK
jgi:endonuclease III